HQLVARWSREKHWVARAEAYDRHLDEKWRNQRETELTQMKIRHAEGAGILVAKAMRRLAGHKESGVLPIDENTMDAQDVVRALEVGVKLERLSMGEATDYIRGAHVVRAEEVGKVAAELVEMALRYIPEERHGMYLSEVDAYARGGS